jgi:hypothetical protein
MYQRRLDWDPGTMEIRPNWNLYNMWQVFHRCRHSGSAKLRQNGRRISDPLAVFSSQVNRNCMAWRIAMCSDIDEGAEEVFSRSFGPDIEGADKHIAENVSILILSDPQFADVIVKDRFEIL